MNPTTTAPTTKQTPVCYNCLSPTRWASEWKDARGTYWFCFTCWPAATALGMTQVLPPNPLTPAPATTSSGNFFTCSDCSRAIDVTVERVFCFSTISGIFCRGCAGGLRYIHGSPTVFAAGAALAPVRTATAMPVAAPSHDLPLFGPPTSLPCGCGGDKTKSPHYSWCPKLTGIP